MATTTSITATIQFEYENGDTRNIAFDDISTSAVSSIKANVLALNATIADSVQGAAYKETFISDDGSPVAKISAAKYTITESTVIYSGY